MSDRILGFQKKGHAMIIEIDTSPAYDEGAHVRLSSEFADLCEKIAWDEDVRALVLTYADGWLLTTERDVPSLSAQAGTPSFVESVAGLKQPVIAAIRGDAIDIGLELALACDIRIGTKGSRLGLPAVSRGSMPSAGGTQRLPRLVGYGKAMEMLLTGDLIGAAEAEAMGLLNRLVSREELMNTALALATEMALKSPLSLAFVKEALHKGMDLTLDQGMRLELDLYLLLFTASDRAEGITAFKEKRKPRFEGT